MDIYMIHEKIDMREMGERDKKRRFSKQKEIMKKLKFIYSDFSMEHIY